MDKINVPAPAKINLALSVTGLREDGFHDLDMIMQTISLHDILHIKKSSSNIKVTSTDTNLPQGRENLAYRAAELILAYTDTPAGVEIFIEKNIPVAAGLAGGSTDAAAVLRGVNKLFAFNLSNLELKKLAASIGSDVPFCLKGGTALATGRGTRIEQLPDIRKEILVLVCPPVKISTAKIYSVYDELKDKKNLPDIPLHKLLELIKSQQKIKWNEGWNNVLAPVTKNLCSDIGEIENIFTSKGVKFCQMTGSGPAVFAIVKDIKEAGNIIKNWPREDDLLYNVFTVNKDFPELF